MSRPTTGHGQALLAKGSNAGYVNAPNIIAIEREAARNERERIAAALPEALPVALRELQLTGGVTTTRWSDADAILAHPALRAILSGSEGEP